MPFATGGAPHSGPTLEQIRVVELERLDWSNVHSAGPPTFMAFLINPGIPAENLQNSRSILCPASNFTASVPVLTFSLQGFPSHVAPERAKASRSFSKVF